MKTVKTLQLTLSLLMICFASLLAAKNADRTNTISAEALFSTFSSLDGKWTNTDPNALPTLLVSGNSTKLRAWGKCTPTNCDWGTTTLSKHGAGFRAVFNSSIAVRILTLNVLPDGRLKVNALYRYKDRRPTKRFTYYFKQRGPTKIDGNWVNLDPNALPKLFIYANSTKIRAWGKCHPTNCPWGTVSLTKLGTGYRAVFNDAVAKRTLTLIPMANNRLKVRATYDYKDSRPTKRFSYTFKKATTANKIDGTYANNNPNALPKLQIYGNGARIRAWGKCSPTNCPWGVVRLVKFGSKYKAVFNDQVAVRTLIITPISGRRLSVRATYNYKDSRPTKNFSYTFSPQRSS